MLARAEYGRLQNFVEKAKPRLQQTDTHQRNLPVYLFALWRANWLQNRLDEAQAVQTQFVELLHGVNKKTSPTVAIMAGWQAVAAGQMTKAEEKLLEAVRRHRKQRWVGTWGNAGLDLAIFYLQTKRPQQALAAWRETAAEMKRLDMPGQPLITGRKVIPLLELAIKENIYPKIAQLSLDAFGVNTPRTISIPDSNQSLTPREVETLQLLMTGATNREIAEQLTITQRTAKAHVSNILNKLQVSTRTEAVARAHELSLF